MAQLDPLLLVIDQTFGFQDPLSGQEEKWVLTRTNIERSLGRAFRQVNDLASRPPARAEDALIRLVRYTSLRDIHQYWLGGVALATPEQVMAQVQQLLDHPQRLQSNQSWSGAADLLNVTLSGGILCWASPVAADDVLPHERHGSPLTATQLVRQLALPGYGDVEARRRHMGLVAIVYELPAKFLFTPNILDAGGTYFFYPGFKNAQTGTTAPLDSNFRPPWQRDPNDPGLEEYVHAQQRVLDVQPEIKIVGMFEDN